MRAISNVHGDRFVPRAASSPPTS